MNSSSSPDQIDATDPTSRSAFRTLVKPIGATNRDADTLRRSLLAQWDDQSSAHRLTLQLQNLDVADLGDDEARAARLALWFSHADPGDGRLVADDHPTLAALSDECRSGVADIVRPASH